jgi:hypothetical protein
MNSAKIEHKTESSVETQPITLGDMEIIYPRWISHLVKDRIMVNSAEEATPFYAEGYQPWPIVTKPTDVDVVRVKVMNLERQIETLLGSLSDDDAKRVTHEIYGDAADIPDKDIKETSSATTESETRAEETKPASDPVKKKRGRPAGK